MLSPASILAIEMKFNAKTSLDQMAKYVALITGEELHGGSRSHLDLLFVFPSDPVEKFEKQTGLKPTILSAEHLDTLISSSKNKTVRRFLAGESEAAGSCLDRLNVSCITWAEIVARLEFLRSLLGESAGDRTLNNLMLGLEREIRSHPLARAQ